MRTVLIGLSMIFATACAHAGDDVADAKAALLAAIAAAEPGEPPSDEEAANVYAAAEVLEAAAGVPDLVADPGRVTGQWANIFSDQGIVGDIPLSFMTRNLPGGGESGGVARSSMVLQELRPEDGFYRNTVVMTGGEDDTPFLYFSTADLALNEETPNVLQVSFRNVTFAPARFGVTLDDVRAALELPPETPLSVDIPVNPDRPPSTSTVTYLDDDLRINRGSTYIAVLTKVR